MNVRRVVLVCTLALASMTVARSGHELPVYPSYYPHEIEIQTVAPERAAVMLLGGQIHAYVGSEPRFAGVVPEAIRTVESLGSFVLIRVNPSSPRAGDEQAACAIGSTVLRSIAVQPGGLIVHPYPVTPLHGDYLHHVDRAEAAKARLLGAPPSPAPVTGLKVKAEGFASSLVPPGWNADGTEWDAEIAEVRLSDLLAQHTVALNGWQGPAWIRSGWFHAQLLLADQTAMHPDLKPLQADAFDSALDRINLERDLVATLAAGCRTMIAGYRLRRETINTEFSTGIENIAFDALSGLHSPMFIRTAKLKDFPWNGWLSLGIESRPQAAWNPIAGFTDTYGRLMWFALGDPATVPSPYDDAQVLNRISDIEPAGRK